MFTKLRQILVRALILYQFESKHHIQIKTNVSNYAIDRIFCQLILNNLVQ